jgi:hypothetical protein
MVKQLLLGLAVMLSAGVASATPAEDYVCDVIADKILAANHVVDTCFECMAASAYFVDNPNDTVTTFEACDTVVDYFYIGMWEPYEEVDYALEDCLVQADRADRLQAIYDASCL